MKNRPDTAEAVFYYTNFSEKDKKNLTQRPLFLIYICE